MKSVYNFLANTAQRLLPLASGLSDKMSQFVAGRKNSFDKLRTFKVTDKIIWFHVASLGEYEQGLPIMNGIKELYPDHKLLLSFFSPSGYENKKNSSVADVVIYLPLDTPKNAKKFFETITVEMAFFVKYDLWPNYLHQLKEKHIPTYLISGVFRHNNIFFKPYARWMKKSLEAFGYFFVQDENSKTMLQENGFQNVSVSGDTRFDRVNNQLKVDNSMDFAEKFKGNKLCVIAGSTWKEDLDLLIPYINNSASEIKFIIAPHEIKTENSEEIQKRINRPSLLFSEMEQQDVSKFDVIILDTIGLLSKIYSYADVAYVGGAAGKTGLHNILEPATFGVPVIIGENYSKFPEAIKLERLAGLFSVKDSQELNNILDKLLADKNFREKTGMISGHFISGNAGATLQILEYFREKLLNSHNICFKT